MNNPQKDNDSLVALSTKLEENFVSPLTALRGALEILRDYPDLSTEQSGRFVHGCLEECARLEAGIAELSASVYAAARRDGSALTAVSDTDEHDDAVRLQLNPENQTVEIDLEGLEFTSSARVNAFYDVMDARLAATGGKWFVLVNYNDFVVWPEAWVAFAHRGKKFNTGYSLGTVRYQRGAPDGAHDLFDSRDTALARIDHFRQRAAAATHKGR